MTKVPEELSRAGVTAREANVFWLVAERLNNREIANRLVISVRTVESHVTALLRKLVVADRRQLAAVAAQIRSRAGPRQRLPRPLDSFVRRDRELQVLGKLIADHRLVTLVGPPGAGKSRLALELARSDQTRPPAVLVDLTAVQATQDLPHAFLDALGVPQAGRPARMVLDEALAVEDVWLVVDNCEHVGDAAAALLQEVLSATDTVWVLATSQRPLGAVGEAVFSIGPLAVPPEGARLAVDLLAWPAVRLFVDRAGAADPNFDPTANPEAVAALCRRLDGLPLALELAAARMRTFTPEELVARLDDRFAVLETGHRRPARHRTLEAAIEWSYHLLDDNEQRLLQRLAVFAGEFEYDDVVAVVTGSNLSSSEVARAFPRLVDRSLVSRRRFEPPTTSFRLLDSIRAFASHRLAEADAAGATARRHAEHYLQTADVDLALYGPAQIWWIEWLERHWADLRQAMRWALAHGECERAWRIVAVMAYGFDVLGARSEVVTWLDDLLMAGLPAGETDAITAGHVAAYLLEHRDRTRALEWAERSAAMAERHGADVLQARSSLVLGWIYARRQNASRAVIELRRALELFPEQGHAWFRASALQLLGMLTPVLAMALEHLSEAAELFASIGDNIKHANVRYMMAALCIEQGERLDDARAWLAQGHHLATLLGSRAEAALDGVDLARLDRLLARASDNDA